MALNLLAQNPVVQEKIRREVDGIKNSGSFTLEDVKSMSYIKAFTKEVLRYDLDPVVQSIVSLATSLRHKFVKQISAKVTNTLLFFVEKMRESFAKDSHIFSTKNNSVFVILMFEILTKR